MSRAAGIPRALVLGVALLTGCAKMDVRVDILNAAFWSSPEYLDSRTPAKIAEMEHAIESGRFVRQREALKAVIKGELTVLSKKTPPEIDPKAIDTQAKPFADTIDKGFLKARGLFDAAASQMRAAARESSQAERDKKVNAAKASFVEGAESLATLVAELSKDLRTNLKLPDESAQQVQDKIEGVTQGLIGDAGILDDPRASAAIYAQDQYWKGEFNKTVCFGSGGNSDCAVKMEGLGTFTLKGVRLDATKITQATFSVTKEAIQTVAAVYGVPIPKSGTATTAAGGDAAAATPADLQSPIKRQRDADTAIMQLRLARLAMLETIIAQRQAVQGTDNAARTQAIKTVKAVLDANRKQLDASSTP